MTHTDPTSPEIRAGRVPEDVEESAEIWVAALHARDGAVNAESMSANVRAAFAQPIVRFALAAAPHRGFVLVEAGRPDPSEALLHYLAVDPTTAGGGIGRALLIDAIEHTRRSGFASLLLEVRDTNERAIGLYTRAGFGPFGDPVPHPSAGYPMQSYRLIL